jgi:peptidase inhibitor I78 family protein
MRQLVLLALLPLAACTIATSNATADDPLPAGGTCRSEPLSQFIGQPASQELGERMLKASGARIIRWVPKGGMITMEFSPERLTVQLDGSNRVERANCG